MASWEINKGIGRSAEFMGLLSQYLVVFVLGLLGAFLLIVILLVVGVPQMIGIGIGVVGAAIVVWQTFSLNKKYGQSGMMKKMAARKRPDYLRCSDSVRSLLTNK